MGRDGSVVVLDPSPGHSLPAATATAGQCHEGGPPIRIGQGGWVRLRLLHRVLQVGLPWRGRCRLDAVTGIGEVADPWCSPRHVDGEPPLDPSLARARQWSPLLLLRVRHVVSIRGSMAPACTLRVPLSLGPAISGPSGSARMGRPWPAGVWIAVGSLEAPGRLRARLHAVSTCHPACFRSIPRHEGPVPRGWAAHPKFVPRP